LLMQRPQGWWVNLAQELRL